MSSIIPLYSSCSTQASSMAIPSLPADIINDILSRLPSKTLIRFKSVSKQWYSLINSPDFINLHLSQTLISQNFRNIIISHCSVLSSPISDYHANPNFYFSEVDNPIKHIPHFSPNIIGSINGVLCFSLFDDSSKTTSTFLYNPSTKTHRLILPFPNENSETKNYTYSRVVVGFGFDSVSRDYKLARMFQPYKNRVTMCSETSVYSLRNESWKCVSDQTMVGKFVLLGGTVVCVNDCLHSIVSDRSAFKCKVSCFNLQTETFSIFDLPNFGNKFSKVFSMVSCDMKELGGCFSVLVNYLNGRNETLVGVDLWVMKEHGKNESWFRLFSIRDLAMFPGCGHMTPVVFSKDKERVLLELNYSSFGWYSWGRNTFEEITVHGWPRNAACYSWTFLDSLVSLSKIKDNS